MISPTGELTYSTSSSTWQTSEFASPILNTLSLAVLTTLISYQVTALITDLLLGTKQRGNTDVPALQTALLVRQATPLAVFTNLLRQDRLTRLYFRPDLPASTRIARDPARVSPIVSFRLLLLLAAAPLINVLSIVLTLESSHDLSFEEAGAGGFALGVASPKGKFRLLPLNNLFMVQKVSTKGGDDPLAEFTICSPFPTVENMWQPNGEVSLAEFQQSTLYLRVQVGYIRLTLQRYAQVTLSNNTAFALHSNVLEDHDGVDDMLLAGLQLMANVCGGDPEEAEDARSGSFYPSFKYIKGLQIPCDLDGVQAQRGAEQILEKLCEFITIVNATQMKVSPVLGHDVRAFNREWFDGKTLPFLNRWQRNLGLKLVALVAGTVTVLRIMTAIIWNNDVDQGIDLIIKKAVGMKCCDSLLRNTNTTIYYTCKYQSVEVARYGLPEGNLSEVPAFLGG